MDLNEFPPEYDYDFLDGTNEETFEANLFFLHSTSTPFSQQIDGAISEIRSSLKYTRLEDIEQVSSHQNQVAADNMHFTNLRNEFE